MRGRLYRWVFDAWESLFHKMFGLQEIDPGQTHLFFIAKRTYMGRAFSVDGVSVKKRDKVIELHINNDLVEQALRKDNNVVRATIQLMREARRSLPVLAKAIQDERFADTKALYGITFIHRGIEKFGFSTIPLRDGLSKRLTTWHLKNILKMLNPDADHIIETHIDVLQPKLVVASKYSIIARYAPQSAAPEQNSQGDAASSAIRSQCTVHS